MDSSKKQKDKNDFSFAMNITKAFTEVESGSDQSKMVIRGVASSTRRDKQGEQFSYEGLECIKAAIENGIVDEDGDWSYVPLRSGHRTEWEDVLGWITKAEIDSEENLWITAELDEDNATACTLYKKISKGNKNGVKSKLGLSVRGTVTKWGLTVDPVTREQTTLFHDLLIKEASVTGQPINPSPYPLEIAKSLDASTQILEDTMVTSKEENTQNVTETKEEETTVTGEPITAETHPNTNPEAVAAQEERTLEVAEAAQESIEDSLTTSESETQNAEAVADAETVAELNVAEQLAAVAAIVTELRSQVELLKADREAQKGTTEVVVEPVILAADATEVNANAVTTVDEQVTLAISKALENLGFGSLSKIADELTVVKSGLADLAEQPVDRSISVSKAKDEEDQNDPFVRMRGLKEKGLDPLSAAFGSLTK